MLERLNQQGLEDAHRAERQADLGGRSIRVVHVSTGPGDPTIIDEEHYVTADQIAAAAARVVDPEPPDDDDGA